MMKWLLPFCLCLISACSTKLPVTNLKTMEQVASEHRRTETKAVPDYTHHSYSRSSLNEIEQLFPVQENPTLVMYVFPHIRQGLPVPGYATAFKLYEKDHYVLPHEATP